MTQSLPERPSLSSLRSQAKHLLKAHRAGDRSVCEKLRVFARFASLSDSAILAQRFVLADAQHVLAQQYGFASWMALRRHLEQAQSEAPNLAAQFITEPVIDEFRRRGVVKVDQLLSVDDVAACRDLVYSALADAKVCRQGRWLGERLQGAADFDRQTQITKQWLKPLVKQHSQFRRLQSEVVATATQRLVGDQPLKCIVDRPQLLFTPPNAQSWSVPNGLWHVDVPRLGEIGCPGVQMFTFIDSVAPGSGGTLTVAGSHHYINDQGKVRSKQLKQHLKKVPWFHALFNQVHTDRQLLERPSRDGDVELQIVEMTGEPGDVYFVDLRALHTLAPNASDRPRLMATQRYFLASLF